jgi:hypothetical protein
VHAALEERSALAGEVVRRRREVVVHVVPEVEGFFVQAAARDEGRGAQHHAIFAVERDDTQAQPFVEHRARADVPADARHERFERAFAAVGGEARQRPRASFRIAKLAFCRPGSDKLRAERYRLRHASCIGRYLPAQATHVLAMHAAQEAHAAVRCGFFLEAKVTVGDVDIRFLEQLGEHRISHAARHEQPHQRAQQMSQRGNDRRRECHCERMPVGLIPSRSFRQFNHYSYVGNYHTKYLTWEKVPHIVRVVG